MKRNLIAFILVAFIAASCGDAKKGQEGSLTDKKAKLEKLKSEQRKINDQVTALEADIAKLDPSSAIRAAKLVEVTPIGTEDFSHYIELQGKVDATNISYVAPPNGQGGIVKALYVNKGQAVRKGQVLARLDDQLLRQQIEPLRVQLAAAEDTYRRTRNLWDQGIGTYQQVLTAQTQVENLRKNIGIIQKQVGLMTVTAPSSGVAETVNVRVGEMFTGANAMGPQIQIVNTSALKVTAEVPENYIGRVHSGSTVEITLAQQNNRKITGRVNTVGKLINPTSRSFTVEVNIPADAQLKPNEVALLRILDYNAPNVITIPLNVVQSDETGKYVYVFEKKGDKAYARRKTVSIGESYGDKIEVKSGLNAGDQLITEGYQNLYEGQLVSVAVKQ